MECFATILLILLVVTRPLLLLNTIIDCLHTAIELTHDGLHQFVRLSARHLGIGYRTTCRAWTRNKSRSRPRGRIERRRPGETIENLLRQFRDRHFRPECHVHPPPPCQPGHQSTTAHQTRPRSTSPPPPPYPGTQADPHGSQLHHSSPLNGPAPPPYRTSPQPHCLLPQSTSSEQDLPDQQQHLPPSVLRTIRILRNLPRSGPVTIRILRPVPLMIQQNQSGMEPENLQQEQQEQQETLEDGNLQDNLMDQSRPTTPVPDWSG